MRNKQIHYTAIQREKALIESITYGKKFNFNPVVIEKYTSQLKEVQAEIQRDKEKLKNFKQNQKGVSNE